MGPWVAGLVFLLVACGGSRSPAGMAGLSPMLPADDLASVVVAEALAADAALASADSLYAPEAVVVADGEVRSRPPRYAGIGPGGGVAITSSRTEVRSGLVWVSVEYRWYSTVASAVREGFATFVITPDARGIWRIRHAHSSSPRP